MDKKKGREDRSDYRGWVMVLTIVLGLLGVLVLPSIPTGSALDMKAIHMETGKPSIAPATPGFVLTVGAMSDSLRVSEEKRYRAFVFQTLMPLATEIAESYPIEGLRDEFRPVFEQTLVTEVMSGAMNPNVFAQCVGPGNGYGQIEIFLPKAELEYSRLDRETFKDMFLTVFLHEHRHFVTSGCRQDAPFKEAFINESETWWWMCEHLLVPMRANGRLAGLRSPHTFLTALVAYDASHGDITSPKWTAFADEHLQVH
ncbi:MAG: hypothetical protein WC802_02730 [Patescibacteria group bacterium]|jgi:hypothetical protein